MASILTLACLILLGSAVLPPAPQTRQPVPIPHNIGIHGALRTTVERSAALSPTLQRQFDAIASARVRVDVLVSPVPLARSRRAETTISRYEAGFIKADIVVPPGPDFLELLAHEFEHVVEQIERVDLVMLTRTGQANRDRNGIVETERARKAGLTAAAEIAAGLRALNAAP